MDLGLRGRVALVTGSSQGIGRATAILFAQEGARIAITYRNNRYKAENVAASATHAALGSMRRHRWGRIVTLSSGLAVRGAAGSTAYSAAKSALHGMTRALFAELAAEGILINVVMAGLTLTEGVKARMSPRSLEQAAKSSPLRRLPAPEEVASTIVFLASAANTTVNGEIVLSSGGHS